MRPEARLREKLVITLGPFAGPNGYVDQTQHQHAELLRDGRLAGGRPVLAKGPPR